MRDERLCQFFPSQAAREACWMGTPEAVPNWPPAIRKSSSARGHQLAARTFRGKKKKTTRTVPGVEHVDGAVEAGVQNLPPALVRVEGGDVVGPLFTVRSDKRSSTQQKQKKKKKQ
jgi:hypothetical protein